MSLNNQFECPIWTPLHLTRKILLEHVRAEAKRMMVTLKGSFMHDALRVLDVGCGYMPYKKCFDGFPGVIYLGADIKWAEVDPNFVIDPDTGVIDAPDNYFEAVVHFQTLEHIPNYAVFLKECYRVLRPGGLLLCTLPFMFHYHPVPNDFRRWTTEGLAYDLRDAGFENIETRPVESDIVSIITIVELFIVERLGYIVTKPLLLMLNLFGWACMNTRRTNLYLHTSGTAQKPLVTP